MESCSNPTGKMVKWEKIKEFKNKFKNLTVIVDNSWLSCYIFNPFLFDVDVVLNSLTKYYSGGTAICGAILFKKRNALT